MKHFVKGESRNQNIIMKISKINSNSKSVLDKTQAFYSNEILCLIFGKKEISIRDLGNLMLTCKHFLNVIRGSNELWRKQFASKYTFALCFCKLNNNLNNILASGINLSFILQL